MCVTGAMYPPIFGKQNALYYIHRCEVVACPFMGAFAFADKSAGYKNTPRLMALVIT